MKYKKEEGWQIINGERVYVQCLPYDDNYRKWHYYSAQTGWHELEDDNKSLDADA